MSFYCVRCVFVSSRESSSLTPESKSLFISLVGCGSHVEEMYTDQFKIIKFTIKDSDHLTPSFKRQHLYLHHTEILTSSLKESMGIVDGAVQIKI